MSEEAQEKTTATAVAPENLTAALEAVLFVSGDGLSVDYLAEKFLVSEKDVENALELLRQKYSGDCGIHLIKYRKNYQFSSNPAYSAEISGVLNPIKERNLTRAALETLSIVAYKQPITRLEIDDLRGVGSDYALQILQSNNLIEVIGRKDTIGKPLLFGTTDEFLKRFDLADINNLPSYEELLDKIKVIQTGDFDGDLYNSNRLQQVVKTDDSLEQESV